MVIHIRSYSYKWIGMDRMTFLPLLQRIENRCYNHLNCCESNKNRGFQSKSEIRKGIEDVLL